MMRISERMRKRGRLAACLSLLSSVAAAGSITSVSPQSCRKMLETAVMSAQPVTPCERLALVRFSYLGFDQKLHDDGEIMVLDAVAPSVLAIFDELKNKQFPIAQAKLMEEFRGDDDLSMESNNTSAYNDRTVADSQSLSFHAYGVAIDLNPIQNPYVTNAAGRKLISPAAGAQYERRRPLRPGMAESVVGVFSKYGFRVWGGRWRSAADYQHFQVDKALARRLISLPPEQAKTLFRAYVHHDPADAGR